jgi:hypothetical protein
MVAKRYGTASGGRKTAALARALEGCLPFSARGGEQSSLTRAKPDLSLMPLIGAVQSVGVWREKHAAEEDKLNDKVNRAFVRFFESGGLGTCVRACVRVRTRAQEELLRAPRC